MTTSIRDVTELVGGRLQFGPMPPVDGNLETIGRILPTCQSVRPRDVVLWCHDQVPKDCFLEEAFARGALGVIAERPVAPWPGRFSLTVTNTRDVLRRLAWWRGKKLRGKRVIIVDPLTPSPSYHLLCQILQETTTEIEYAARFESEESLLWQIIAVDPCADNTVVHVTELPSSHNWRETYAADIFVLCPDTSFALNQPTNGYLERAARQLKVDTHLVMPLETIRDAYEIGWRGPLTSYGFDNRCNVIGERTAKNDLSTVNGIAVKSNSPWRKAGQSLLAAVGTALALGIPETEIMKRIDVQSAGDNQRRVAS